MSCYAVGRLPPRVVDEAREECGKRWDRNVSVPVETIRLAVEVKGGGKAGKAIDRMQDIWEGTPPGSSGWVFCAMKLADCCDGIGMDDLSWYAWGRVIEQVGTDCAAGRACLMGRSKAEIKRGRVEEGLDIARGIKDGTPERKVSVGAALVAMGKIDEGREEMEGVEEIGRRREGDKWEGEERFWDR